MKRTVGSKAKSRPDPRDIENAEAIRSGPQRKKKWSILDIKDVKPLTANQTNLFQQYYQGDNVAALGCAGTGKSFVGCYLGIQDVLDPKRDQKQLIIIRSAVQTREQGHMPGNLEEKQAYYELPYREIMEELFGRSATYEDMKEAGIIRFMTTTFVRGLSWHNAVIVIDEVQNMTIEEIDSVMTRVGRDSRVIVCGDNKRQNDLNKRAQDQSGMKKMLSILPHMKKFSTVEFTSDDIVRGEFAKSWIMASEAAEFVPEPQISK